MVNSILSKSDLFKLHKKFYSEYNINFAWGEEVDTFFWTNNNFIASKYSKIIRKIVEENDENINIIELGAGQGRFSFFLLNNLKHLLNKKDFSKLNYIMTDLSPDRLEFWKNHEKFIPYIQEGNLDFTLFDITNPEDCILQSNRRLSNVLNNGINIVISNYTLSDLGDDLFTIKSKELFECLLDIDKDLSTLDKDYLETIKDSKIGFKLKKIDSNYYESEAVNGILKSYLSQFDNATFDIPIDAINTFDFFKKFSTQFYWLISDEANYHLNRFKNKKPHINKLPSGLLSNKTNLNALKKYVKNNSCNMIDKQVAYMWFDTYMIVPENCSYTDSLKELIEEFNTNDFLQIFNQVKKDKIVSMALFSLIKLSGYDPYIIRVFSDKLTVISKRDDEYYKDVLKVYIKKCWDNYFNIDEDFDMAYCIGIIFKNLGLFEDAVQCFEYSLKKNKDTKKSKRELEELSNIIKQ